MERIEKDFDERAKEFYNAYYPGRIEEADKKDKYYFVHNKVEILIKGDTCFNLSLHLKNSKKWTLFGSIIKDEEKSELDFLENTLEKLRYSPMNISIMPQTGGLNNIKQSIGNDRFDTFIWLMNQYYTGLEVLILNAGSKNMHIENRKRLKKFLDSYDDVYDYCKDIYGIDTGYVNKLIKHGKKPIISPTDYYEYIELALEFWEKRMEQYSIKDYIKSDEYEKYTRAIKYISLYIRKHLIV